MSQTASTRNGTPAHRVRFDDLCAIGGAGARVEIGDDEGTHAVRVKRLRPGESIELLDGRGLVAEALVEDARDNGKRGCLLAVQVFRVTHIERPTIDLEVCSAVPKAGRLEGMLDALSQLGVRRWSPLICERAATAPDSIRPDRLVRLAWESAKQCGRAHVLELGLDSPLTIDEAISPAGDLAPTPLMADGEGAPLHHAVAGRLRFLIGPEGGWSSREIGAARQRGTGIVRLGVHTMRIETAACAAAALVMGFAVLGGVRG